MSRAFRFSTVLLCTVSVFGLIGTATAAAPKIPDATPIKAAPGKSGKNDVKVTHYNDWDVRCPKSGDNQDRCEMTQLINNPKSNKPIMRVVMGYPPQIDTAAMIFITPLGTRLAPGMGLSVDGDKARRFPFQICLRQGCRADYPVSKSLLGKLKKGHDAEVTIVGPEGHKIKLNVPLSGFTAANTAITPSQ